MNKKLILSELQLFLFKYFSGYEFRVIEDQLVISKNIEGFRCRTSIRCQNFGDVYLMNPQGISIFNKYLESQFNVLVFSSLKGLNIGDSTIVSTTSNLRISQLILDFKIEEKSDFDTFCEIVKHWLIEVEQNFFLSMMDDKNIAQYIAQYSYQDSLRVVVGGRFPVMQFKKIFLLYIGGQKERYEEYKVGLEEQIKSLPQRKPEKKDDAKIYLENLYFLIQELESGNYIKQFV